MSTITHISDSVSEYKEKGESEIRRIIAEGHIKCGVCFKALGIHSSYIRGVKETKDKIRIVILRCKSKCEGGKALLPDFLSPNKHYSIKEIEKVVFEAQDKSVSDIDTEASESTVRRWISQVGERITAATSVVKAIFVSMGAAVSELAIDARGGFCELESLLDAAPKPIRHSGATLGLANLWLRARPPPKYI
jgi:hypothetical protein